jgi:very-short-patch-repair endonuclease
MSQFQKKYLQTPNEQEFFEKLQSIFPNNYIAIQVAMSAIITSEKFKDRSQFRSYYLDYVICDKKGREPLLVIELDDSSHKNEKNAERDKRKNGVLQDAQIPLIRFQARNSYSTNSLQEEILPIFRGEKLAPKYERLSNNEKNESGCLSVIATILMLIVIAFFSCFII